MKKQPIGIELPKETINALLNGADKISIPIPEDISCLLAITTDEDVIQCNSPLQINDEFYVQEPFFCLKDGVKINSIKRKIAYQDDKGGISYEGKVQIIEQLKLNFEDSVFMTYEQSRLKDLITTDIQIKRVQELNTYEKQSLCILERKEVISFTDWVQKQDINYEENPYVFLCSVSKKESERI